LLALLERPGEIATREELRARLWGPSTYVDFERSLNIAINKLRAVLGDESQNPRYIETVPRRGIALLHPSPLPQRGPPRLLSRSLLSRMDSLTQVLLRPRRRRSPLQGRGSCTQQRL
jgi:hypothetical protein